MIQEVGFWDPMVLHPPGEGWAAFFGEVFGLDWPHGDWMPDTQDLQAWERHALQERAVGEGEREECAQKLIRWLQLLQGDDGQLSVYS